MVQEDSRQALDFSFSVSSNPWEDSSFQMGPWMLAHPLLSVSSFLFLTQQMGDPF